MGDHNSEPEELRRIFIGGLNYETTEETLKSHFEKWGEIVDCVVMRDPKKFRSRGFGFITYKNIYMADDARAARPHKIDGYEVEPRLADPKKNSDKPEDQVKVKKLFVKGLKDSGIEEEDLRTYFGKYGNIVSVKFGVDKVVADKKLGFAFIEFDDCDPVDKIVLRKHRLKNKKVSVRKSFSNKEKKSIKKIKEMKFGGDCGGYNYGGSTGYGSSHGCGSGFGNYGGGYNSRPGTWNDGMRYGNDYPQADYMPGKYISKDSGNSGVWVSDFGGSSYSSGGPLRGSGGYSNRASGPYGDGYSSGGGSGYGSYRR